MQITDNILQYYEGEISHSVFSLFSGLIQLVTGLAIIYLYPGHQFIRGMSYLFVCAGLFFMLGGSVNILHKNNQIEKIVNSTELNQTQLQNSEIVRMEKVLDSAYITAIVLFSLSILTGLILFFFKSNLFLKGIATGLFTAGLFGLLSEFCSIEFNRNYYNTIKNITH